VQVRSATVPQLVVVFSPPSSYFPFSFLLQLMDVWPVGVKRRGKAPMPFVSKEIYFTCVQPAEEIFYTESDDPNLWAQWERRVEAVHLEARE